MRADLQSKRLQPRQRFPHLSGQSGQTDRLLLQLQGSGAFFRCHVLEQRREEVDPVQNMRWMIEWILAFGGFRLLVAFGFWIPPSAFGGFGFRWPLAFDNFWLLVASALPFGFRWLLVACVGFSWLRLLAFRGFTH